MPTDPGRTIEILETLQSLGFDDAGFRILHHRRDAAIRKHVEYCQTIDSFQKDRNNSLVQRRLEMGAGGA